MLKNEDWSNLKGIGYKKEGNIKINPLNNSIEDFLKCANTTLSQRQCNRTNTQASATLLVVTNKQIVGAFLYCQVSKSPVLGLDQYGLAIGRTESLRADFGQRSGLPRRLQPLKELTVWRPKRQ